MPRSQIANTFPANVVVGGATPATAATFYRAVADVADVAELSGVKRSGR